MKNKKLLLAITFLLIAISSILIIYDSQTEDALPITLDVNGSTESVRISGWLSDDIIYFFLPSYADMTTVKMKLETENTVLMEDSAIQDNMTCEMLQLSHPYNISYTVWGKIYEKKLVLLKSDNLATIYIDTQSGSMKFLHENKENSEPGSIKIFTDTGILDHTGTLTSISCRGNASWTETDKKSYGITLSCAEDLLNQGAAENWILLANALDGSHLRNKLVHDAAKAIGLSYSADLEWVDLYLNGEYAGLYLLSERNEIHQERVNIAQKNSILISGEMESRLVNQRIPYISTNAKQVFRIHYPKVLDEITTKVIYERLQSVENSILTSDGVDPFTGKCLEELIDFDSFAKRYLIDEVFGNIDGGIFSQFFYIDGSDPMRKLYAGPVWDYDLSMGSDFMWQIQNPFALYANRPNIKQGINCVWTYELCRNEKFFDLVIKLYQQEMVPFLNNEFNQYIKLYEQKIESSAYMDCVRWQLEHNFHDNIESLYNYMNQRIEFLNSMWVDGDKYHCVTLIQGENLNNAYYMVRDGECIQELPELEDTDTIVYKGWYSVNADEPFDISEPIVEDLEIYAKKEVHSSNSVVLIAKVFPLIVIAFLGIGLLIVDIRKYGKV